MKNSKNLLTTAAILGMVTIILGAFGAHALKEIVSAEAILTYETGVKYQMYHVFALLLVALSPITDKQKKTISRLLLAGILLFSGSIYILTFREHLTANIRFIGPVTPIGGACFIAGWAVLAYSYYKLKN